MKKRLISALLILVLSLSLCLPAAAVRKDDGAFTMVTVPYSEGERLWAEDYQKFTRLFARYADDKTPIPLSVYYSGYIYATIPAENASRKIEAFIADKTEFSDYDETVYEFYNIAELSMVNVFEGDENGAARPFDKITRAEAVAIIMRFLGLEAASGTKSGFDDVTEDKWYASVVTSAREYGIINGVSDKYFQPNRDVTRQEFTAMLARGLWLAELRRESKNVTAADVKEATNAVDASKISSWARGAYETIGAYCVADEKYNGRVDAEGFSVPDYYANPKKAILRHEAAEMIRRCKENYQVCPSPTAMRYGFDKEMPVIDGSTSTYPFTEAVYRNLFYGGWNHQDKPTKHSKSHASYENLINGKVDMLFASAKPTQDIFDLAEEKGVELEFIPIAMDAMVFFTNKDNPAKGLTTEQISDIYVKNAYSNWKDLGGGDALLYPYCRNNDSGSHAHMEKYFLNGGEIHEKIRNETTSVTMSNVLTDVMGAKTESPLGYAMGYSIYYYYLSMDIHYETLTQLKLLKVDGVAPSEETIANGTYPLAHNAYVVLRKDSPSGSPERKMAEFMLSPAGQECVKEAGYGPIK